MGFILEPRKPENIGLPEHIVKRRRGRAIVGLNVSGLLFMGGYTKKNMFALRDEYPNLVREIIRKFIEDMNTDVILIPHVFGETNGSESDLLVCREIYDEWNKTYENRIFLPSGSYNQNEIKYIIGLCDFFVGSRMHACIAALSQHIPAISIAYSKKFQGVLNTIGVEDLVVDPRVLPIEDIIRIIEEVYSRRDTIRKKLEEIIPSVKSTVMDLFNPNGPIFQ
jgi:polysaccharide pyruvyl transferase WcaK-like protein